MTRKGLAKREQGKAVVRTFQLQRGMSWKELWAGSESERRLEPQHSKKGQGVQLKDWKGLGHRRPEWSEAREQYGLI